MGDFHQGVRNALNDPQIRKNFRRAMDGLMSKRKSAFTDTQALGLLRHRSAEIRSNALRRLPELLQQLEKNCNRNGIQVHWAESVTEANGIVLEIMQQHQAKQLIKGKSMVSEEMGLHAFLEEREIECLEAKLGILPTLSTLCGACGEVCPVRIPLPKLLNRLRYEGVRDNPGDIPGSGARRNSLEALTWKLWGRVHSSPIFYRFVTKAATRLRQLTPAHFGPWTRAHTAPRPASRSLHELARRQGLDHE